MSETRRQITIAGHAIGKGHPCFVIAEAGVNHNGDLATALALIDVAARAGASAVKFQTFSAERLATAEAPQAEYQVGPSGEVESQRAVLARLELSESDHRALVRRCCERGITFLSTPFDEIAADFLESLPVPAFKIPSGELTNLPFLQHVARKGKPMIVSTGMATLGEVEAAVGAIASAGNPELALLHCVSNYPARPETVNLRAMRTLELAFRVPVGYSDHTSGLEIAFAARALGASIVEKHYTTDRTAPGPDHRSSLEPHELAELVRGIRVVESSLGDGRKAPAATEGAIAAVARKSLVAARRVRSGVRLSDADVAAKRPGTGISPALRDRVVGRRTRVPIPEGSLIAWDMLG